MVTFEHRLSQFTTEGDPPERALLEVLCRDHNGTYVLPFTCEWHAGAWHSQNGPRIEVAVIGWRKAR